MCACVLVFFHCVFVRVSSCAFFGRVCHSVSLYVYLKLMFASALCSFTSVCVRSRVFLHRYVFSSFFLRFSVCACSVFETFSEQLQVLFSGYVTRLILQLQLTSSRSGYWNKITISQVQASSLRNQNCDHSDRDGKIQLAGGTSKQAQRNILCLSEQVTLQSSAYEETLARECPDVNTLIFEAGGR